VGTLNKSTIQSYYQNPGQVYDDIKIETIIDMIVDAHNATDAYATGLVEQDKYSALGIVNVKDKAFGAIGDGIADDTNAVIAAINAGKVIYFPPGTYKMTAMIPLASLQNKILRGSGDATVIQFIGDIIGFQFHSITNCLVSDMKVLVDPTNTNNVFSIRANTTNVMFIAIRNVKIDTKDGSLGLYTGVRLYSNTSFGVFRNLIDNVQVDNCKDGIVLETGGNAAWITHNVIHNIYINRFSGLATGFKESLNSNMLNNTIAFPRILDQNITDPNNVRTAIKITGQSNSVVAPQIFNDGQYGTFYAFDFTDDGAHNIGNSVIGGGGEGLIKSERIMLNNYFDCTLIKRKNALQTFLYTPIKKYTPNIANIIKNYNWKTGLSPWVVENGSASIQNSIQYNHYSHYAFVTKTANDCKLYLDLPVKALFADRLLTFTAAVRSSVKCYVLIDEGSPGYQSGTYHSGGGDLELLSVTKKIVGGGSVVRVAVFFDNSVANGSTMTIDWVCANYGATAPNYPISADTNYTDKNKGNASILSGQTAVTVTHELNVTPSLQDIRVTPTNSLGSASKYWISNPTATTFQINVNVDPGVSGAAFVWNIDV
jgi:hypothetical protein